MENKVKIGRDMENGKVKMRELQENYMEYECVWLENIAATRRNLRRHEKIKHGRVEDIKGKEKDSVKSG